MFNILSYAAGIIDGEGCIAITRTRRVARNKMLYHILKVEVGNTKKPMVDFMVKHFGGGVHIYKPRNPKHKIQYRWNLSSKQAAAFLRKIKKYSICKQGEIAAALEYRTTYRGSNNSLVLTQSIINKREEIRTKLRTWDPMKKE